MLEITGLSVRLEGRTVVDGVDLSVPPGAVVGLLGANGSGKSTLLRSVYRALGPAAGRIEVDGADVWASLSARDAARRTAAVTQHSPTVEMSVRELVELGRAPHLSRWGTPRSEDRRAVDAALERTALTGLEHRLVATLSGGERQRVLLARALAGEPRLLVLDEPTNHLDVAAQLTLLELVRDTGTATLVALHDLDLAGAYCDLVYLLQDGRVVAHGTVTEVLTPQRILAVFGVRAHVDVHPLTGRPRFALARAHPTTIPPILEREPA